MTNTLSLRTHILTVSVLLALVLALFVSVGALTAHAALSGSLDLGDTGSQVTELQTYLATNASIYPEGLVTGYFGALTQAAVQRFQVAQGIVSSGAPETTGYGRVGPTTRARINSLMGSGSNVSLNTVPTMSSPNVQYTNTTATYTWTTNEPTTGQVYWSTSPIVADEATGPRQTPYVSGTLALDAGGLQTSHTVTVSNLQANTTYYYIVRVIDNSGDITMTWPPGSFRTSN